MRIAMIGTGYVGLVSGACFSEFGIEVTCVDKDAGRVAELVAGRMPIYEPGLDSLVAANVQAGRLVFSTDVAAAVAGADAVFIAVGTPSRRGEDAADVSFVHGAAREVAGALAGYTVVVTKSTVPVGTGREVEGILRQANPGADVDVASNPEFLREGSAINDFMRPDRVIVGAESERAREVLREIYRPLFLSETPVVFTTLETAELAKYAANAFLATKVTFINEIADLCERVGAQIDDVAKAMGLDGRIGRKFLHPGPGFGGSCFPKDTLALAHTASAVGVPARIVEATVAANQARKEAMADRVIAACGGDVAGKAIAVLGLTFKPNTDDMREAPSLEIIPRLQRAGAAVRAHDPQGMAAARKLLADVTWCATPYGAVEGAHALVLVTEWNAYRLLDLDRVRGLMATPLLVDLRNVYPPGEVEAAGIRYHGIGRPARRGPGSASD